MTGPLWPVSARPARSSNPRSAACCRETTRYLPVWQRQRAIYPSLVTDQGLPDLRLQIPHAESVVLFLTTTAPARQLVAARQQPTSHDRGVLAPSLSRQIPNPQCSIH